MRVAFCWLLGNCHNMFYHLLCPPQILLELSPHPHPTSHSCFLFPILSLSLSLSLTLSLSASVSVCLFLPVSLCMWVCEYVCVISSPHLLNPLAANSTPLKSLRGTVKNNPAKTLTIYIRSAGHKVLGSYLTQTLDTLPTLCHIFWGLVGMEKDESGRVPLPQKAYIR